jgi:DNA-binding CsgD family transcriptional regulator
MASRHRRYRDLRSRVPQFQGWWGIPPSPIFLPDGPGKLQEANRAAERFLAEEKAARIERGRLIFTDARVRSKVAAAVAAAARGENNLAATAALQTPSGRAFAMKMLPPLPANGGGVRPGCAGALHPGGRRAPIASRRGAGQGLTPAEIRLLVLLAQGMNLPAAADRLGVSETTVKTHMQRVFVKTGTHRQAEVVKLVMSALRQTSAG